MLGSKLIKPAALVLSFGAAGFAGLSLLPGNDPVPDENGAYKIPSTNISCLPVVPRGDRNSIVIQARDNDPEVGQTKVIYRLATSEITFAHVDIRNGQDNPTTQSYNVRLTGNPGALQVSDMMDYPAGDADKDRAIARAEKVARQCENFLPSADTIRRNSEASSIHQTAAIAATAATAGRDGRTNFWPPEASYDVNYTAGMRAQMDNLVARKAEPRHRRISAGGEFNPSARRQLDALIARAIKTHALRR